MPMTHAERNRKYNQSAKGRTTRVAYDASPRGREARNRAQATHRARRYAVMAIYKHASGCVDCGYRRHMMALDFDHRPGVDKCFNISSSTGLHVAEDRFWAEIAKCDVRCSNCHRVITTARRNNRDDTLRDLIGALDGR